MRRSSSHRKDNAVKKIVRTTRPSSRNRRRLRLEMPVHHLLEEILNEYIVAAALESGRPLFQSLNSLGTAGDRKSSKPHRQTQVMYLRSDLVTDLIPFTISLWSRYVKSLVFKAFHRRHGGQRVVRLKGANRSCLAGSKGRRWPPLILTNMFRRIKSPFHRPPGYAAIVAASWLGILGIETAAQASNREQVAPAPDRPWAPPNLPVYESALRKGSAEALQRGKQLINVRKEYTLPDLIDLAEQLNPATREAWQNAKQALALVGVSKSAYYPFISLAAGAGITRIFAPFPELKVNIETLKRAIATRGSPASAVTLTAGPPFILIIFISPSWR